MCSARVIFERFSLVLLMPRGPCLRLRLYSQGFTKERPSLFVSDTGDDIHGQLRSTY
jgi:hypothetical protein